MTYYEITNLPMIKFPVITRWRTFIDCCHFVYNNFEKIHDFIKKLDKIEYESLYHQSNSVSLISELKYASEKKFISNSIKYLEADGLTLLKKFIKLMKFWIF